METVTGFDPDVDDPIGDIGDDDQGQGDDVTDAPYGYLKDGVTPRKSPAGRPPKDAPPKRPRGKRAPTRRRSTSTRPPQRPPSRVNYAEGIENLLGLVAIPLRRISPVDSITLAYYAPALAGPLAEVVEGSPAVAVWADKILKLGPHGELATVLLEFGAQLAANRGMVPVGEFGTQAPGALARECYIRQAMRRQKMTRAQAEAAADQAAAEQEMAMAAAQAQAAQAAPDAA